MKIRKYEGCQQSRIHKFLSILLFWDILISLEIFLHTALEKGLFNSNTLSTMASIALLSKGHLLLLLVLTVFAMPLLIFKDGSFGKKIFIIINVTLLWIFSLFYLASWYFFSINNTFCTRDSIQFVMNAPIQFFQHITHTISFWVFLIPLIILLFIFLIMPLMVWIPQKLLPKITRDILCVHLGLVFLLIFFSIKGDFQIMADETLIINPDSGIHLQRKKVYADILMRKINPLATLLFDRRFNLPLQTEQTDLPFRVERRSQVSLDEYINTIDKSKIKPWNVILLIVESLRPDQLINFGGNRLVMGNLDKLASQSIRFTDNYTQASHSNYADPCLLSSHYPLRSRRIHYYPKEPPYPIVLCYDILKKLGYRTAIFSSQNEYWGQMFNYLNSKNLDHFLHSETFQGPTYTPTNDTGFVDFMKSNKKSGKIDDRFTVAEAIKWIDGIQDNPFFIYMNLQNSHIPFTVPADFEKKFSPKKIDFQVRFGDFPRDKVEIVKGMYSDSLAYVDFQFGKLLKYLKDKKLIRKTIIIVTGDTGQAFYEHGFASHAGQIYDEVMRVPLFFYVPGTNSYSDDRPAQHIDIPPTLFSLMDIPSHPSFQGIDLITLRVCLKRSRFLVAQTPIIYQFGIVRNGYKLINTFRTGDIELYNLKNDPQETLNLASKMQKEAADLKKCLDIWYNFQIEFYENPLLYNRTYPPFYYD